MLSLALALVSSASANDITVGGSLTVDFAGNIASAPVAPLTLEGGLYRFTPTLGTFDAANPWGGDVAGCDGAGAGCTRGWTTSYRVDATVDGETSYSGGLFQTGALAVAGSTPRDLCLSTTQDVLLINNDVAGGFVNNTGGLSIHIQRLSAAGDCAAPIDWVIFTANQTWGSDVLNESSPNSRLRPSVVNTALDALDAEVTGLGCASFESLEWAGAFGSGSWSGSTEEGESVDGTYGRRTMAATVDGVPAGDVFGSYRRGRGLLNVGPVTNGAAGHYIRVQGTRGVWVGGEITCPSDVSTLLGSWLSGT